MCQSFRSSTSVSCGVLTVGRQVTFGKFLFVHLFVITLVLCLVCSYIASFSIYLFIFVSL